MPSGKQLAAPARPTTAPSGKEKAVQRALKSRAARERSLVDRARNTARSATESGPAKALKRAGRKEPRPPDLDKAMEALEAAVYSAGDDWVEQTSRARSLLSEARGAGAAHAGASR